MKDIDKLINDALIELDKTRKIKKKDFSEKAYDKTVILGPGIRENIFNKRKLNGIQKLLGPILEYAPFTFVAGMSTFSGGIFYALFSGDSDFLLMTTTYGIGLGVVADGLYYLLINKN
ncbi:hypothetical protein J4468_04430 [Candidatus Woesearchaeota archaeon]|nr:hypothetical protein [Candidatus Woesearchaeota archaeon]